MSWRRLTETPVFGATPPPWRPWRVETRNPRFGLPNFRKHTLCRVTIEQLLDGSTVSTTTSGWDYFTPFEVTSGAVVTNGSGGNNKLIYTLEAAPDIGQPWRYLWRDRVMPAETYNEHEILILPGDTHVIEYEAGYDESLDHYESMLCVIA